MQTRQSDEDMVKAARTWLKALGAKPAISPKTKVRYEAQAKRLLKAGNIEEILTAARDTRSKATWFYRRAALIWVARSCVQDLLTRQDKLQREMRGRDPSDPAWSVWKAMVKKMDEFRRLVDAVPSTFPVPVEQRKKRRSKRRDLRVLESNWRQILLPRLPKYRLVYLVAAISGCRPAEFVNGVRVRATPEGVELEIFGAKVTESTGQPRRMLRWSAGSVFVNALRADAQANGGEMTVRLPNKNGPRQFSNAMAAAGKRQWSNLGFRMTPYMLRHQLAADLKEDGREAGEIAMILGHVATGTQSYYGHHKSGRGGALPAYVEATRVPRETRKARTRSALRTGTVAPSGPIRRSAPAVRPSQSTAIRPRPKPTPY